MKRRRRDEESSFCSFECDRSQKRVYSIFTESLRLLGGLASWEGSGRALPEGRKKMPHPQESFWVSQGSLMLDGQWSGESQDKAKNTAEEPVKTFILLLLWSATEPYDLSLLFFAHVRLVNKPDGVWKGNLSPHTQTHQGIFTSCLSRDQLQNALLSSRTLNRCSYLNTSMHTHAQYLFRIVLYSQEQAQWLVLLPLASCPRWMFNTANLIYFFLNSAWEGVETFSNSCLRNYLLMLTYLSLSLCLFSIPSKKATSQCHCPVTPQKF